MLNFNYFLYSDTVTPYVRRCIETFTSDYIVIHRKYRRKASPIARERLILDTPRQDFEVCIKDLICVKALHFFKIFNDSNCHRHRYILMTYRFLKK